GPPYSERNAPAARSGQNSRGRRHETPAVRAGSLRRRCGPRPIGGWQTPHVPSGKLVTSSASSSVVSAPEAEYRVAAMVSMTKWRCRDICYMFVIQPRYDQL